MYCRLPYVKYFSLCAVFQNGFVDVYTGAQILIAESYEFT